LSTGNPVMRMNSRVLLVTSVQSAASAWQAIQRSLDVVSRGRTTIVIAHRLSIVCHADCIHLLEAGRIVESGTHDELVARNGGYAALWRLQTGERGYLPIVFYLLWVC
jgi:ATP-binding cassette subfamily B protein